MDRPVVDPNNAASVEYRKRLEKILEEGECPAPFCKEHAEYHTEPILFVTDYWRITLNSFNSLGTEHRFLIVHKEHITEFSELSSRAWSELREIQNRLTGDYKLQGATLIFRSGATNYTGATVPHLHCHLISGCDRDLHSNVRKIMTCTGFEQEG